MTTLPPDDEPGEPEYEAGMVHERRLAEHRPPEPPYIKVDPNGDCWVWRHGLGQYVKMRRIGE